MLSIKRSKSIKLTVLAIALVVFFGFGFLILVKAEEPGAPTSPPRKECGDGIIQSPNEDGKFEKCDEGKNNDGNVKDTDYCTSECGQKLLGWAWADAIGWVSLNNRTCDPKYLDPKYQPPYESPNYQICFPQSQDKEYYLQATADNEVLGYAWSDNAGWICFGTACEGDPPGGIKNATLVENPDDIKNPPVLGWAKILSLGEDGWISLNCKNFEVACAYDYQVRLGYSAFGAETNKEDRLTLKGWAWNTYLGWLRFDPEIAGLKPWLQTKYSDIYARLGLKGETSPPATVCNATYRILSNNTITNFCSTQGQGTDWIKENYGAVNFPTAETLYSNVLGRLDIKGLVCEPAGAPPKCFNRYGTIVEGKTADDFAVSELTLGNKIYYYTGEDDLVLGGITFKNGSGFVSGAGTIIVNGNLNISDNIVYEPSGQTTSFKNLASVAWIILGDLRISPSVKEIAGNFIVLGNEADGQQVLCGNDIQAAPGITYERREISGCGQIYTCCGDNGAICGITGCEGEGSVRLTVNGLMMAKKFYFDRKYKNIHETPIQGSEVIIYDGRLLVNTPPGLSDFAKALPIWRSGSLTP